MTFAQKLEYLSTRRMLVFFHQPDNSDKFFCNIAIVGRRPVISQADSLDEAFEIAFDRAVFKLDGMKLCANR